MAGSTVSESQSNGSGDLDQEVEPQEDLKTLDWKSRNWQRKHRLVMHKYCYWPC